MQFADAMYACDAMIWSTPTYHGSISGSFKNALDWLILLAERDPPYLSGKPVGLVATAGGIQGLQAVNSMDFIARALRAWSVPLVQPVAQASQSFGEDGQLNDQAVAAQLRALGAEVTRAARQFRLDGTCDYADGRQFGGG
jgi:FMN reductase